MRGTAVSKPIKGLFLALALLAAAPALAQGAKVSSPVELARRAETLKPGQWVWAPKIAPAGPLLVYVDLSRQLATIYLDSGPAGEFWAPARAVSGPVTVVMSRSDQMLVVLRNGVEIGRSRAVLPADNDSTHVLTLGTDAAGKPLWLYVGVAGHTDESDRPLSEAVRNRVQVPSAFYARAMSVLTPGATLLVTSAPLSQGATGTSLTVLNGSQ